MSLIALIELVNGDVANVSDIKTALDGVQYVFHFASSTIPQTATENAIFDVESNVVPILRLIENCPHGKVRRIIYSSSGGTVYGIPKNIPISEDHQTDPLGLPCTPATSGWLRLLAMIDVMKPKA